MAVLVALAACSSGGAPDAGDLPSVPQAVTSIELASPGLDDGGPIRSDFTCDGRDVSPPLKWAGGPRAAEYALVLTDPDAPGGTFVHWVVFGIPGSARGIAGDAVPVGAVQGTNSFGSTAYQGPCPPAGETHRYVFRLYALSRPHPSSMGSGASGADVLRVIRDRIEATGLLRATYRRSGG